MQRKKRSVFGVYRNRADAEKAVDALQIGSFSSSEVSVLPPSESFLKKALVDNLKNESEIYKITLSTKTGIKLGSLIGLIISFIVILTSSHSSYFPSMLIEFGLVGILLGGVIGGTTGALIGACLPIYSFNEVSEKPAAFTEIKKDGVLLAVQVTDQFRAADASRILKETGAIGITIVNEFRVEDSNVEIRL